MTVKRFNDHVAEAKQLKGEDKVLYVALQGSQNYGLSDVNSDVDTKCLLTPNFYDIAMNSKPVSTTHVRANDEHIDMKDFRLYFQTFRKQNINFVEILFTDYYYINPDYKSEFERLRQKREEIARYNEFAALKCMKGMALEKHHALCHPYPSKKELLDQYGYDGKQLSHMYRLVDFADMYIKGYDYKDCLTNRNPDKTEFLIKVKRNEMFNLAEAKDIADLLAQEITEKVDSYCAKLDNKPDPYVDMLLDNIQYAIMAKAVKKELFKEFLK